MLHDNTIVFAWEILEFEYREKTARWYWIVGLVALALIVLMVWFKNYLFAFVIFVGTFLIFSYANKQPALLTVEVSEQGIKVANAMYPYSQIQGYWMNINHRNIPLLQILTNRRVAQSVEIPLPEDLDIEALREYLGLFLEEVEIRNSLTEKLIDRIGF